ncbi:unnamed protein product [Lactuca virosa]|uniref:Transposase (putative) gypsy type domain-containing protein n=1 Tax=Lactuca virosa TaxID=75947 RepID=A0AAU9MW57_9ASTR|nr:unnamed protein product [Lactuca virosa]
MGAIFFEPPEEKIGMYVKHLDVGYCLPTSDFFWEILDHHKVHFNKLVSNDVSKVVDFEILCHANDITPGVWLFCHFSGLLQLRLVRITLFPFISTFMP